MFGSLAVAEVRGDVEMGRVGVQGFKRRVVMVCLWVRWESVDKREEARALAGVIRYIRK